MSEPRPVLWRWGWPDPDDEPHAADEDELYVDDARKTVPPSLHVKDVGATAETKALIAAAPEMEALLRLEFVDPSDLAEHPIHQRCGGRCRACLRRVLLARIDAARKA